MKTLYVLILMSIFSIQLHAQSLTYEGTLFDSNGASIAEPGVKLKAEIFDNGLSCVLYEREYTLDLSASSGHFLLNLSGGSAPSAQPHTANTIAAALSNANGNSVTCANSSTRNFTGTFVKRQIRVTIIEVNSVDISDIQLPPQDLELMPFANEAETAKLFTGTLSGDVTGTSGATKVTKIQGVAVDNTAPTNGQILKYDNGSSKYVPSAIDSTIITDNSVTVDDLDFASSSGIDVPTLTTAPAAPSAGQIYYNSVDNKVYFYNGSGWIDTGAGGGDFLADGSVALTGNINLAGNYLSGDGGNEGVFINAAGNVGIGTTSPNAKLTVEGAITLDQLASDSAGSANYGSIYSKTDGKLYYRDGTGTISNLLAVGGTGTVTQVDAGTGMTGGSITATGTIGLANTAVTGGAYGSATQVPSFTVDAQGRLTAAANITITDNDTTYSVVTGGANGLMIAADKTKLDAIEANATADQTAAEILTATKTVDGASSGLDADLLDAQSGAYYLDYANFTNTPTIPDGNSLDASDGSPANALSVDAAGNVGLGTTAPNYLQQNNSSGGNSKLQFTNSFTGSTTTDGGYVGQVGISLRLINQENAEIEFGTNNISRVVIDSIGNMGIGDLLPNARLEVAGDFMVSSNASGNGDNFIVNGSGNVGIGTTSPNAKLTIEGIMTLDQQAGDPTGTAGYGSVYAKSDGKLYYRDGTGTVSDLLAVGTGTVTQVDAGTGMTGGSITATGTIGLANTAVTGGAYGSATQVPSFTVDAQGRLTAAANVTITDNDTTYSAVTGGANGLMIAADKSKLDVIEASATADQTAAEILTAIKTVDGASSGLDADLLDAQSGAYYLDYNNFANTPTIPDGNSLDASDGAPVNALSVDAAGNVGIGTTTPSSPLEVNGVIHSTTGGIKFPDNSVQLTASSSSSSNINFEIFKSSGTFTVPASVTRLKVTLLGGGGGSISYAGCGVDSGGAGGSGVVYLTGMVPSASVTVTVGAGGGVVSSGSCVLTAPSGGASSFGTYASGTAGQGESRNGSCNCSNGASGSLSSSETNALAETNTKVDFGNGGQPGLVIVEW